MSLTLGHLGGSVKRLTLDFSSGHNLAVCKFKPCVRFHSDSAEPAWDSLSPFLSATPCSFSLSLSLSLSLSINK